MNTKQLYYHIVIIILLYTATHSLMLINTGLFWDDYTVYKINPEANLAVFSQAGFPFLGYYFNFISSLGQGILIVRFMVFASYLISGLCLFYILDVIKLFDRTTNMVATILFLVIPVNLARITLICSSYAFFHMLFWIAFAITVANTANKNIAIRIISICLFFFSFNTNSLLVFFTIVVFFVWYYYQHIIMQKQNILYLIYTHIDYALIAPIYFAFKSLYLKPYGIFENYNSISFSYILNSPKKFFLFLNNFANDFILNLSGLNIYFLILTSIAVVMLFRPVYAHDEYRPSNSKSLILLLLGMLIFFIGLFPYLAVGLTPELNTWSSRHLLLTPLGLTIIIVILSLLSVRQKALIWCFGLTISACIILNINFYLDAQLEWFKWSSFTQNIKHDSTIKNNTTFLVDDNTVEFNAFKEKTRFYEYTGMMRSAFGDESRYAQNIDADINFNKSEKFKLLLNSSYGLSTYIPTKPQFKIIITKGTISKNKLTLFKLMYYMYFNKNRFDSSVSELIKINTVKLR